MPRLYFTGRKKLAQDQIELVFKPGRPPEFTASIDLSRNRRSLPADAKVIVEAFHNTLLQRFDFGTVADCRPRQSLRLDDFDEWEPPRFRVRVVDVADNAGMLLAACDRVAAVDPEEAGLGGRSLLKLFPRPSEQMHGELWRIESSGGGYRLAYNKDVPSLERDIKSRSPMLLGLILPAAFREILARELLWEQIDTETSTEWVRMAQSVSSEPLPAAADGVGPFKEDVEDWIERAVQAFCLDRGRFVERIAEMDRET